MAEPKQIDITYEEPQLATPVPVTRLEDLYGQVALVSAVPTWIPRRSMDYFALYENGSTRRLYAYVGTAWRYSPLT